MRGISVRKISFILFLILPWLYVQSLEASTLPPVYIRNISSTFLHTGLETPQAWIDVYVGLPYQMGECPMGTPFAVVTLPRYPLQQTVARQPVYTSPFPMDICGITDLELDSLKSLRASTLLYLSTGEVTAVPVIGEYNWGSYIDRVEEEDLYLSMLWRRDHWYLPLVR